MNIKTLPVPDWMNLLDMGNPDYYPDAAKIYENAQKWRKLHNILPANGAKVRIEVLSIDTQRDFCHKRGTLYVAGRSGNGAELTNTNAGKWMLNYLHLITGMTFTIDTHLPFQVFYPTVHKIAATGENPPPYTLISADEYRSGKYVADSNAAVALHMNEAQLTRQWTYYCEQLEKPDASGRTKYQLYLWPFHCMLGEWGHLLVGMMEEIRLLHAFIRYTLNTPEIKGGSPYTENYSIFAPEVMTLYNGSPLPLVQRNVGLIKKLLAADAVVIFGQAGSHCVRESATDFGNEIISQNPKLAEKIYVLRDGTDAVVIPGMDYTPQMEEGFATYEKMGMHVVESTTPLEAWPGMDRILGI